MDFTTAEQEEGVRFIWNALPTNRIDVMRNIIPISLLYSPFFSKEEPVLKVEHKPLCCSGCKWVASPFCPIDYTTLKYDCVNCNLRCTLPTYYRDIVADGYTIPEFQAKNNIIDYVLHPSNSSKKPFLMFLIDRTLSEVEFKKMKQSLIEQISSLTEVFVGLITVGKHVYIHDLSSSLIREIVVSSKTEYKKEELMKLL